MGSAFEAMGASRFSPFAGFGETARRVFDFLLPPRCLSCADPLMIQGAGLCPECWNDVTFIAPPFCRRSGIPLRYDPGVAIEAPMPGDREWFCDRVRAAIKFDGAGRRLVYGLKYGDRHEGVEAFALWMKRAGADVLGEVDLLLPTPLSRLRLFHRRFNQAASLARALGKLVGTPVPCDILRRRRSRTPQTRLTREQRRRNVSGSFETTAEGRHRLQGKRVAVIDDVITTGATVNACARTLLRAGAQSVDALALARVYEPIEAAAL